MSVALFWAVLWWAILWSKSVHKEDSFDYTEWEEKQDLKYKKERKEKEEAELDRTISYKPIIKKDNNWRIIYKEYCIRKNRKLYVSKEWYNNWKLTNTEEWEIIINTAWRFIYKILKWKNE